MKAPDEVTEWIIGRRCPIHGFVQTQYVELREQVYRDAMTGKDAAAELQTRADAEWAAQGLTSIEPSARLLTGAQLPGVGTG